jgi:hypothetical protein
MRRATRVVCATIVLAADGCGGKSGDNEKAGPSFAGAPQAVDGMEVPARATRARSSSRRAAASGTASGPG